MALLSTQQLGAFLQRNVKVESALEAIRVAEGWLRSVTRIEPWPDEGRGGVPEDLRTWAMELSAIKYSNPEGLATLTVKDVTRGWRLLDRAEILAAAAARYGDATATGPGTPLGSFPPPWWPDGQAGPTPPWPWPPVSYGVIR